MMCPVRVNLCIKTTFRAILAMRRMLRNFCDRKVDEKMGNSNRLNIGGRTRGKKRTLSGYASFALFVAAAAIALSAFIVRTGKDRAIGIADGEAGISAGTGVSSAQALPGEDDAEDAEAAGTESVESETRPTRAPAKETGATEAVTDEMEDSEQTAAIQVLGGGRNYVRPSGGAIIKPYSMDALVYSKTMNDWRAHCGLDIAAEKGEVVKSAGEGKVAGVSDDPLYGTTVVVNQNDGYMVYYRGLNKETAVRAGENIAAGATIGTVGEIPCESADGTHLHIEVMKENKYYNPADALGIR